MIEYINKNDAIKIVSDMRGLCRQDVLQDAIKSIEALENQEIGHWIEQENGNMLTYHRYKCSVCNGKRTGETGDWVQIHECKYPYCPDCGAKMEGE